MSHSTVHECLPEARVEAYRLGEGPDRRLVLSRIQLAVALLERGLRVIGMRGPPSSERGDYRQRGEQRRRYAHSTPHRLPPILVEAPFGCCGIRESRSC